MKYTRYNIKGNKKPKNSNNIIILLIISVIIAFLLATIFKSFIFNKSGIGDKLPSISLDNLKKEFNLKKEQNKTDKDIKSNIDKDKNKSKEQEVSSKNSTKVKNGNEHESINSNEGSYMTFYSVQCGVFKSEENAKHVLSSVKEVGAPFILKEGDLYKVINGVFFQEESNKVIEELKKGNIEGAKFKITISKDNTNTEQIGKLSDALLKVLNKLNERNIKEIKTDNIKKWTADLKEGNKKEKNYTNLVSLKKHINELPKELKKDNLKSNYEFLFKLFKDIK
ncbi:SPOR domain-containing protein [Hathewaya histolytica]|uniref:Transmembrane protein n=1 Tax=Hathewaya histolytica TaxID=1498 RepID=A0A4U9RI00_HATHI|nr:SPOR domain-containing protein [Hathewaya histolytica]VTQ90906.1 transmembrane protein [Hathewaya histolytica]